MSTIILKQIAGDSLKLRQATTRGFLQGGNFIHAEFQNMNANGDVSIQILASSEQPTVNQEGSIQAVTGEAEWFGVVVGKAALPVQEVDPKLSLLENAQNLAIPLAKKYLEEINPTAEFSTITI